MAAAAGQDQKLQQCCNRCRLFISQLKAAHPHVQWALTRWPSCAPSSAQVAQAGLHLLTDGSKIGTALVVLVDGSWVEPQRTRFRSGEHGAL